MEVRKAPEPVRAFLTLFVVPLLFLFYIRFDRIFSLSQALLYECDHCRFSRGSGWLVEVVRGRTC